MSVIPFVRPVRIERVDRSALIDAMSPDLTDAPAELLARALERVEGGDSAEMMFYTSQLLQRVCLRFSEHVTLAFPGRHAPLLVETLQAAFHAYRHAGRIWPNGRVPVGCFVEQIAASAFDLVACRVRPAGILGEEHCWQPFYQSLGTFAAQVRAAGGGAAPVELVIEANDEALDAERAAAPNFLLTRILSPSDYGNVMRFIAERGK